MKKSKIITINDYALNKSFEVISNGIIVLTGLKLNNLIVNPQDATNLSHAFNQKHPIQQFKDCLYIYNSFNKNFAFIPTYNTFIVNAFYHIDKKEGKNLVNFYHVTLKDDGNYEVKQCSTFEEIDEMMDQFNLGYEELDKYFHGE